MIYINCFYRMKWLLLLLVTFFAVVPLFSQIKGNSGTIQLKSTGGEWREIQIGAGLTISNINCDSLLVGSDWVNDITQIVIVPCDTIMTSVPERDVSKHSKQLDIVTYPNPSSGHTIILINSSTNDLVIIKVYSILGVLVREFEPIIVLSSPVEINWDLKNYFGSTLPAGVYLIQAVSLRGTVTHKIQIY